MIERLTMETRGFHGFADEDRLSGLSIRSVGEYRAFLARIYGFEAPVEAALARMRELDRDIVRGRYKASSIREDLVALGGSRDVIAALPTIQPFAFETVSEALGWLYVIERQTLVAGLIHRELVRVHGAPIANACRYFSAYGERTGANYRRLGEALAAHRSGAIVVGARHAFRAHRAWTDAILEARVAA